MIRIMLALVFSLWFLVPVAAQEGPRATVQSTVQAQIDAFLRDDFEAAFGFASPTIQQFFGNFENFGAMVRQGYPMVWRPADVRFLDQNSRAGRTLQNVMIRDGAGVFHVLEYEMTFTDNGWQINGVRLVQAPEVGA